MRVQIRILMKIARKKSFTQTSHINSQQLYYIIDLKFSKSIPSIKKKYTVMKTDFTHFNKCTIDSHLQHPFIRTFTQLTFIEFMNKS